MNDLKIELSVLGVAQALAKIAQVNAGIKQLSQSQKQMNAQAGLLRAQISLQKNTKAASGPGFGEALGMLTDKTKLVIAATIGVAVAFGKLVEKAVELGNEFARMAYTSGGTHQQTGLMAGMSGFLGQDASQMARALADAIAGGGYARAFGAHAQINDTGIMGDTNKASNWLAFVKYLRSAPIEEALRAARATNQEAALSYRQLSDAAFEQAQRVAMFTETAISPQFIKNTIEMKSAFNDLQVASSAALVEFMKTTHTIEILTAAFRWLTQQLMAVAIGFASMRGNQKEYSDLVKVFMNQNAATVENTAATRENTRAMNEGIFGGGERARGAIPERWKGGNASMWSGQITKLGAFAM